MISVRGLMVIAAIAVTQDHLQMRMAPTEFTARSSKLGSTRNHQPSVPAFGKPWKTMENLNIRHGKSGNAEVRHGRFGWVSHTLHRNVALTRRRDPALNPNWVWQSHIVIDKGNNYLVLRWVCLKTGYPQNRVKNHHFSHQSWHQVNEYPRLESEQVHLSVMVVALLSSLGRRITGSHDPSSFQRTDISES